MRLTIIYRGKLPSNGSAKSKHNIREQLHPQLANMWLNHPALVSSRNLIKAGDNDGAGDGKLLSTVGNATFSTLVHPYLHAYAELDILLLRPHAPSVLTAGGDIDNQLKTLFDALRRPRDSTELPKDWKQKQEITPLHCLLEDDKLVSRVNVETDRLLEAPLTNADALVIIRVTIKAHSATWGNLSIIA